MDLKFLAHEENRPTVFKLIKLCHEILALYLFHVLQLSMLRTPTPSVCTFFLFFHPNIHIILYLLVANKPPYLHINLFRSIRGKLVLIVFGTLKNQLTDYKFMY